LEPVPKDADAPAGTSLTIPALGLPAMHPSATTQPRIPSAPASGAIGAIERAIVWVGSPASLAIHTVVFIAFFTVSILKWAPWDLMLLVLTTVVSLEAIYLALFIQMSVNRQSISLREVEEDVEDIQEDIEELGENVEDLKEDVEDIQEDIGEISEDESDDARERRHAEMLETLTRDVGAILNYLESLKAK
jgi:ElaB/YqjD/DUF883 family membrane-anchored ribosome-binding protein